MIKSKSMLVPPKLDHTFEWIWTAWLLSVVASFGVLEGTAIHRKQSTLSRFVWELSKGWPPFPWTAGILVGFLGAHFFWQNQGIKIAPSLVKATS